MGKKIRQMLVAYGMVLPAFLTVMLTVAYPIALAVVRSFKDQTTGAFTFSNYTYFFTTPAQFKNLLYTLFVVVMTVAMLPTAFESVPEMTEDTPLMSVFMRVTISPCFSVV